MSTTTGIGTHLHTEVVMVTPEMADAILATQVEIAKEGSAATLTHYNQRRIDPHRRDQYAREMMAGNWKLNGEAVLFNGSLLLNGQHRLAAVSKSGVSVPMLFVRGVEIAAFSTIDQGKTRTISDLMSGKDWTYKSTVAGAARLAAVYEVNGTANVSSMRMTRREVFEYAVRHKDDLTVAAMEAAKVNLGHGIPLTLLFFLVRHRREAIATFIEKLRVGANLSITDPVFHLRKRLIDNLASRAKHEQDIIIAWIFKAWNAHAANQSLKLLRYGREEEFPVVTR